MLLQFHPIKEELKWRLGSMLIASRIQLLGAGAFIQELLVDIIWWTCTILMAAMRVPAPLEFLAILLGIMEVVGLILQVIPESSL